MLEEIKKIQGINHDEFDTMIKTWISAAQLDLKSIAYKDYDTVMETVIKKNFKIGQSKAAVLFAITSLAFKLGQKTVSVLLESFT